MTKMFSGELAFLSNFSEHPVLYDGFQFPTLENAYQASKTTDRNQRAAFVGLTPGQSKRAGRALDLRPDWEQRKVPIMRLLLASKFTLSPHLAELLVYYGDFYLVETNTWHDNEWGDCLCGRPACAAPGKNLLGISLMRLRDFLIGIG